MASGSPSSEDEDFEAGEQEGGGQESSSDKEQSSGEIVSEEAEGSSSEEEDGENEYDLTDKFLAGEDDVEGDGEPEEAGSDKGAKEKRKRHKRRREKSPELDEEDYQLLEDAQVSGIRRKQKSVRKRIRKQQEDQNKSDAQRLQEELFGVEAEANGLEDDDAHEAARAPAEEEDVVGESEDEMAGFIDDDDFGGRQAGRARARRSRKSISSQGVQDMQDIFGDVDDLLLAYAEKRAAAVVDTEAEAAAVPRGLPAEEAGGEEDDDELAPAGPEMQEGRQERTKQQRLEAAIEPDLMQKLMIQPADERIRQRDAPERYQLSGEAELKGAFSETQLGDAARWIVDQLVGPVLLEAAEPGDLGREAGGSKYTRALAVLRGGILEVEGKPRDGRPRQQEGLWDSTELEEGLTDLSRGGRGLKRERDEQQVLEWRRDAGHRQALVTAVARVLKEMWDQQHEIPVIACFRKQLCGELLSLRPEERPGWTSEREARQRREAGQPEFPAGSVQAKHRRIRRWDVLWGVAHLAARWRALLRRKERRLEMYRQALAHARTLAGHREEAAELEAAIQGCAAQISEAASTEELEDIDAKFRLVTAGQAVEAFEDAGASTRRPQRSTNISLVKKAGVDALVRAMAMPAADFGSNLARSLKRNQPQDTRTPPLELAYEHVVEDDPGLDGPEKVLQRARQVVVLEVVCEPQVRAFVRQKLDQHMMISTAPTASGEAQLDAFHVYGRVKRLARMPAGAFEGRDDYLRINLAEKEGLITVVNEVEDLERVFVQPMLEYYESSAVSAVSREWNLHRHTILREAVQRLVPELQQEANSRLLADARAVVLEGFGDALWEFAAQPPVQMRGEDGDEVVERRRFAACCWGQGDPATCLVMLDEQGCLLDVAYLASFSGQLRSARPGAEYNIARDPRKARDVARVVDFCRDNRPQAIFVGARNHCCVALKEDMARIGDVILDAHAQILTSGHDTGTIEICYAEETLADLWSDSAAAREEFPDHSSVVRRAVALGRLALEPLAVLAALLPPGGREILSLNLHPLQTHVLEAERLKAAEAVLMTAVAQVGADINLMAANQWLAPMLQFVAGLGPRKAQSLLQAVQSNEYALNRISLWNEIWKPGNAIFRNCGPFLRVTAKARGLVNAEVEAIDSLRIEPLSYRLAFEVAHAAVGGDPENREEDLVSVNKALNDPEKVEELDLEELHDRLAGESDDPEGYDQISTLVNIAMEFVQPAMELRQGNMLDLAEQRETYFWWVYGESPSTLKPGRRVEALVKFVGQREARCCLPELGDLEAVLAASDISASSPSAAPADFLKPGQTVAARIKTVKPEDFCVELSTTSVDLNDETRWEDKYCRAGNAHYHVLTHDERKSIELEKRRQARNKVLTKRTINHPNFKNVSMNDAVKLLAAGQVGDAVFRPSLKSINMVCLTMKLHSRPQGDLIVHKDVKEGPKRGGLLTLGSPLTMLAGGSNKTEEKYEDLDEILARYAEPVAELVQQVVSHRKYREGDWEDIRRSLQQEGTGMRGTAIYCLAVDYLHPGMFYIGSVLPTANRTPRREYFSISPEGLYFRQKTHKDVEKMLAAFKRKPQPVDERQAPKPPPLQAAPRMQPPLQGAPHMGHPVGYGAFEPQTFNPQMF